MKVFLVVLMILFVPFLTIDAVAQNLNSTDTNAEHKFDNGFYQKIQDLIKEPPPKGDVYGASADSRYHNVIIVVSRAGDDKTGDDTAKENKDALVKQLKLIGSRHIVAAESLSFVTASIPVDEIPDFALNHKVFKLGDGEQDIDLYIDTAKITISGTPADLPRVNNKKLSGDGVVVAVLDSGINSVYLNDKVRERIYCSPETCKYKNGLFIGPVPFQYPSSLTTISATHGTQVAQIIAASGIERGGQPRKNGLAPGVTLLDAMYMSGISGTKLFERLHTGTNFVHSLDWAYSRGADIVNMSVGTLTSCNHALADTLDLIMNEAVDKGMLIIGAAGNHGYDNNNQIPKYASMFAPKCAHNLINVGGIDDRSSRITMFINSSRGPQSNQIPILEPDLVAPASKIHVNYLSIRSGIGLVTSGTSLSAPLVSASAALMLEADPSLTPLEVKSLLLLGARWTGPIPCTSEQYEQSNPNDNCSYARQPTVFNAANNKKSIGILNNVGFGILDTAQSIRYSINASTNLISDYLDPKNITSRSYTFTVTNQSEPVKIILSWFAHPHGTIRDQSIYNYVPVADLNFTVRCDSGQTLSAESSYQTSEFVVFRPLQTGTCTVTVTGSGLDDINKPVQNYALASTLQITSTSRSNGIPTALSDNIIIDPDVPSIISFTGHDPDDDSLSFTVTRNPTQGVISNAEFVTKNYSRALYTPNSDFNGQDTFQITPSDGINRHGTLGTITLIEETLPPTAKKVVPSLFDIHKWHVGNFSSSSPVNQHTETFSGIGSVSAIYLSSVNVIGGLATFNTSDGVVYQVAVPSDGRRMINFSSPVVIDTMQLSSKGILEKSAQRISKGENADALIFAGYTPTICNSISNTSDVCSPGKFFTLKKTLRNTKFIPDATYHQNFTSTISISNKLVSNIMNVTLGNSTSIPNDVTIRNIAVFFNIVHTHVGHLKVVITSPNGTSMILYDQSGGNYTSLKGTVFSKVSPLIGTNLVGDWVLSVGDYRSGGLGLLKSWGLYIEYFLDDTRIVKQPILVQSTPQPTSPPVVIPIPGTIIDYANYINLVNTTIPQTYATSDIDNIFGLIPACSDPILDFDHNISMTPDGIKVKYTVDKNYVDDSIQSLLVLDDDTNSLRTLSLNLVPTGQNSTHLVYTSTIPNNLFNNMDDLSITSYISSTSSTIHNTGIFSNSSTGSPLFYHNGTSESNTLQFMQLPDTVDAVQFVNGTNTGMKGTVYVPDGNNISLSEDILCRYATIKPSNIADLSNIKPSTISNTTNGLLFELKFKNNQTPDNIQYIITNSTNTITDSTSDTITRNYNLTIPISANGNYDITIYGTLQDKKILGIHNKSYTFNAVIPDPVVIPDPPQVPDPPTRPVQPVQPTNDTDSDVLYITIPESIDFDTSQNTIDLNTYATNKIRIDTYSVDTGTRYHINDQADITIFRNTEITNKEFTYNSDNYCYSGDLRVGTIPGITIPIENVSNVLYLQFREHSPDRCDQAPDIDLTGNLDLDTNVYVRFSNTAGLNPFYSNGTSISPIPKCDITNFDDTTNTLKNINACYGKSGNDMILVSKVLSIFGVTAQDITTQPDPAPLDPPKVDETEPPTPVTPIPPVTHPPPDSDIISITLPESMEFDISDSTLDLKTYASNKIRIDTYDPNLGTRYFINDQADITIFRNTEITGKTFNYGTDQYCYSGDLRVGTIPGITLPITNISNALYLQFREHSPDRCDQAPDIDLAGKLILDTEVYVRFANSIDLNLFYYVNDSDNTVDIPKCTDTNFDSATNRLQNDTMICYGKDDNDVVIISKILAVFGTAIESDPIPPKSVPVPILVPGNIIDHADYTNLVNTTVPQTYEISNIDNVFSIIPACSDTIYEFDHDISMTSDGIVIKYTVEKSRSSDSIQSLIVLDDKSTSPRTLSLNLVPTGQNSTHLVYTSTIPNNLFNNLDDNIDNLSITSYISSTSNTVHKTGIFSNSSTGSPLFYHNGTSESSVLQFLSLPDATDTVQFVNGTNTGISGPVHVPDSTGVLLSDSILCRYASINPNNIADMFDISPNTISNTTNGLEFALTFTDDIPDQINWFAVNSTGNTVRGSTIDTITRDYNLTIPLSISDTYDITIYGTVQDTAQDIKILGLHNSSYKFTIPVIPDPAPLLSTRNYHHYADIINSTTLIAHEASNTLYNAIPKCDPRQGISHSVIMSSSGDIILEYSTKRDFADGKVLITIKNDTGVSSSISLDPTFVGTNNNRFNYTSIIPNNILDTSSEHLVVNAFFFSTSNTIKNERVYSTSPDGSPLYYHKINGSDPIIVQLPPAASNVPFVAGTVNDVSDPVYIPKGKRISLTDDMFCEFGFIKPKQIARIYDMNINAANTTDGLEFTYEFGRKTFSFGDKIIREPRPSQFNWIVSNSTYNMTGSTTHDIKNTHNFTIPLSQSDDYDVVIYGTNKRGKLIGTHSDSYAFTVKSITQPVAPDPQQPTQPDPPKPVTPVTPDPQQPSTPNKNDDTNLPILPITLPESYSHDIRDSTIDLNTYDTNKIRIDTYVSDVGTKYYINNVADITIHRNTEIINKTFAYNTDSYCYSGDLRAGPNIPGITIPIENVSNVLYLQFREHSPDRCDQAPDIDLDGKLILDTEVYVRFANSIDLNPFYYVSDSDNTVDIPKCTDTNFDSASNKLLNAAMICYGKGGNDIVIISKILAVFGVAVESDPIPPKSVPVPILVPGNIIDHADYTNLVNTTVPQTYEISNIDNVFSIIPACSDTVYEFDHDISMTSDGIVIKYTVEKSRSSDSIQSLIVLDDKSTSPRTLSLNLVPTGQNSTHLVYTTTIPNNLFNSIDKLSVTSYISSTSNTVHKTGIFSNSSTGSPLFYHNGTSESSVLQFLSLPDATDTVQFVSGTNDGIRETVYIPDSDTISLSESILCRYANITPNNIADIFDITINTVSNTTNGLKFALTFADDIPDQINWFAANSTGDIIRGNTVDIISSDYNFTIPLSVSGTYDITIYGTVQDSKIVGLHDNSYEFTMPVIPDPPTMSISLPDSESLDNNDRTIDLNTLADNSIRIDSYYADTGTRYYINDKADITIYRNTMITDKTFTYQSDQYCYVGDLLVGQDSNINTQHTNTLQLLFRQADDPTRCDNAPSISLDGKLVLDQEVYIKFTGTDGQTPFYYDNNIVKIPKCTSDNFDSNTSTLKNSEICYGKNGDDTIIISKILTIFGVQSR